MGALLKLGAITLDVVHKDIKNIHLSVYPPVGAVRISAPLRMNIETIRLYAISKLGWIKKQQLEFKKQERESPREYLDRESHFFLGKRYLLKLLDNKPISGVFVKHSNLLIHQKGAASVDRARVTLQNWYRKQLRTLGSQFIAQWEPKLGVTVKTLGIKVMKTKWGTCNPAAERIWLNLDLAKKPLACIEYIVVHEMVHLLERKHNDTFIKIMNSKFPKWEYYREELNTKPLKNENWTY